MSESSHCRPDYSPWTANSLKVGHRRPFSVVLILRCSTQASPLRTREVFANNDNVRNLHKAEHLKSTRYFVHWIINRTSDENCFSFKSHKARTFVDKDRSHEITACFGSKYLYWWMVGKKSSGIPRRVEYFLSRMWRRWIWLRSQASSSDFSGQTLIILNYKLLD